MLQKDFKNFNQTSSGLTLIEVLVTLVISVVLGATVMRFYKDSYRSYSLQEQITDRNQNAHYVLTKMVEVFQQMGASLPDSGWGSLTISGGPLSSGGILSVGSNPKNGKQTISVGTVSSPTVTVDPFAPFDISNNEMLTPGFVLITHAAAGVPAQLVSISARVKDGSGTGGTLTLASSVTLNPNDVVYAYRLDQYLLVNNNFVIRQNGDAANQIGLAENIDSIGFTFRQRNGTPDTTWGNMRSVSLTVRARTEKKDPHFPGDGYRKISLPMNVLFKNKV